MCLERRLCCAVPPVDWIRGTSLDRCPRATAYRGALLTLSTQRRSRLPEKRSVEVALDSINVEVSSARYLGIKADDALEISEQTGISHALQPHG